MKTGRNDPCPCGSGRKYKECCLSKDEAAARTVREAAAETAAAEAPAEPAHAAAKGKARPQPRQPWKGAASSRGFQRVAGIRKVGGG
jgi:hypothetical protein